MKDDQVLEKEHADTVLRRLGTQAWLIVGILMLVVILYYMLLDWEKLLAVSSPISTTPTTSAWRSSTMPFR